MKKTYNKPQTFTVVLRGPVVMLDGSNEVHEFSNGGVINVGDDDDPPSSNNPEP